MTTQQQNEQPTKQRHIITLPNRPETPKPAQKTTKRTQIIALLSRHEGATIEELMTLTNWQQHTVRGFFSRVINKLEGFALSSQKIDSERRYYLKQLYSTADKVS
ncbi:DUF3489 domain-containing protein [Bartonella sp. DGB2]|uniref:DUF3489 domain-containing protein n=1 Tax=Bartonella sp. DGB2 TaxID=3388426 RepID=UPI00398FBE33